jgi:hypothetical protein
VEAQMASNVWQQAHAIQVLDADAWLAFCGTEFQPCSIDCGNGRADFLEDSTESTKIWPETLDGWRRRRREGKKYRVATCKYRKKGTDDLLGYLALFQHILQNLNLDVSNDRDFKYFFHQTP